MLSNVTKSMDMLRGATEMQDLWMEVCESTPIAGLPGPRQLQNEVMVGKIMDEQERRETLHRLALRRQQRNNFYLSESAKKLQNKKTNMPKEERKEIRQRLAKRPDHTPPRPKSPTAQGHILATGEVSPSERSRIPLSPKSRAEVSSPGTEVKSSRTRSRFEGVTHDEMTNYGAKPSFAYKPAMHDMGWQNLSGFAKSTRTLERRKMNPYADINSFQGNRKSAEAQFDSHAHVRPLDVKGALGAQPVQDWKEALREDFARDSDNHSTNACVPFTSSLRQPSPDPPTHSTPLLGPFALPPHDCLTPLFCVHRRLFPRFAVAGTTKSSTRCAKRWASRSSPSRRSSSA